MIQAVLFDLDGTLWDRDRAFRALVEIQHRTFAELTAMTRERLKLGLITNGPIDAQESKIDGLGLAPLMDTY